MKKRIFGVAVLVLVGIMAVLAVVLVADKHSTKGQQVQDAEEMQKETETAVVVFENETAGIIVEYKDGLYNIQGETRQYKYFLQLEGMTLNANGPSVLTVLADHEYTFDQVADTFLSSGPMSEVSSHIAFVEWE